MKETVAFTTLKSEIDAIHMQQPVNPNRIAPVRDTLFVFRAAPRLPYGSGREKVRCLWAASHALPITPIEHEIAFFTEAELAEIKAHGEWNVIERDETELPAEMLVD